MKRSISSIRPRPKNGEERERRNESFPNTVVNSALTPIFVRAIRPRRGRGGFLFRTTAALSRAQVTHRYPPRLYDRLLRTGRSYLNLGYTASGWPCVIRVTRSQGRLARRIRLSAIRTGAYKGVLLHAWPLSKLLGDLGDSVVSRVTEKSNGRYAEEYVTVPSPIPPTTDAWPIIRRI